MVETGTLQGYKEQIYRLAPRADRPNANTEGVDQRLVDIIQKSAHHYGLTVRLRAGVRPGDKRLHGRNLALDITLYDQEGRLIPDYQSPQHFRIYEQFAQTARAIQMRDYPELSKNFRWGGYFSGMLGKTYGAMDLMHFDLGPTAAMAAGSWEGIVACLCENMGRDQ